MRTIKTSLHYLTLFILILILSVSIATPIETYAEPTGIPCVINNEKIDGQGFNVTSLGFNVTSLGFNVTSLGFNVTSLGFNVTSLGFNVTSLGFNVTSLEDILVQLVTEVEGDWLITDDPTVDDPVDSVIGGAGYNSVPVVILVVDDFTNPPVGDVIAPDTSHGYKVRATVDWLINLMATKKSMPNITVQNVDIGDGTMDASLVAGEIKKAVDALGDNAHVIVNMSFGLVPCDDDTDVTLTDSESGETFTVTADFNFQEFNDITNGEIEPELPFEKISPVLECVVIGETTITGYWGYNNKNNYTVEIPLGEQNKISPTALNGSQPTVFAPGRHRFVFSQEREGNWNDDEVFNYGNIVWTLNGKTSTAGTQSPICEGEVPEPSSQVAPVGYGLSNYFVDVMGIPPKFVDEYFQYLFNSVEEPNPSDDTNPFDNIQTLMRYYLQKSHSEPNFALIPVASSGNFRHLLGGAPLKPAAYPEVIASSARVGDNGTFWPFSHDGNIEAPGVSVYLARNSAGEGTVLGAGTSYSAPHVSLLAGLWLTYPNACNFVPAGLPPLANTTGNDATVKTVSPNIAIFTSTLNPFDCGFGGTPEFSIGSGPVDVSISEGATKSMGTVIDPDGTTVNLSMSANEAGITVNKAPESNDWSITAGDGPASAIVTITATDADGETATTELNVTVANEVPQATFNADRTQINIGETITLSLTLPTDPSSADVTAGFTYDFTCGNGQGADNATAMSFTCQYDTEGTYDVTGTIRDKDGGEYTYDIFGIEVISRNLNKCYAREIVEYSPGKRKNGDDLPKNRQRERKARGKPQNNNRLNFVSLGLAHGDTPSGSIIVGFKNRVIVNTAGDDVRIWETSYGDQNRDWSNYPEAVDVYASIDGETWEYLGTTDDKDEAYDLGTLPYAKYIKLVDVTDPSKFNGNADGFDVDAIEGLECGKRKHYE